MTNINSLNNYYIDNSNLILDNSNLIVIDNCRNSLDFIKNLKFEDAGVYQFNSSKARFKIKVDMLYSDPSTISIDDTSKLNNVTNNDNISRNEDFIITSLDNNIHIVTKEDKKIQLWGNVLINDKLIVYDDVSFNNSLEVSNNLIVQGDASIKNILEVSNNLTVLGDVSINKNLTVQNNVNVIGNIESSGTSTFSNVNIDNLNIDGNTISGATSIISTSFIGSLYGDISGNVTGNLTGDVTGNADTATAVKKSSFKIVNSGLGDLSGTPVDSGSTEFVGSYGDNIYHNATNYSASTVVSSGSSCIKMEFKVNFICSPEANQTISFRVIRTVQGLIGQDTIFTDENIGSNMGIMFRNVYNGTFIDDLSDYADIGNNSVITYQLQYKRNSPSGRISTNFGIVNGGNYIFLQEIYA